MAGVGPLPRNSHQQNYLVLQAQETPNNTNSFVTVILGVECGGRSKLCQFQGVCFRCFLRCFHCSLGLAPSDLPPSDHSSIGLRFFTSSFHGIFCPHKKMDSKYWEIVCKKLTRPKMNDFFCPKKRARTQKERDRLPVQFLFEGTFRQFPGERKI